MATVSFMGKVEWPLHEIGFIIESDEDEPPYAGPWVEFTAIDHQYVRRNTTLVWIGTIRIVSPETVAPSIWWCVQPISGAQYTAGEVCKLKTPQVMALEDKYGDLHQWFYQVEIPMDCGTKSEVFYVIQFSHWEIASRFHIAAGDLREEWSITWIYKEHMLAWKLYQQEFTMLQVLDKGYKEFSGLGKNRFAHIPYLDIRKLDKELIKRVQQATKRAIFPKEGKTVTTKSTPRRKLSQLLAQSVGVSIGTL